MSDKPFDHAGRTVLRASSRGVEVIQHGMVVADTAENLGTGLFSALGKAIGEDFISPKAYRDTVSALYAKFAGRREAIAQNPDLTPERRAISLQEAANSLGEDIAAAKDGLASNLKIWKEGNPSLLRTPKLTASEQTAQQLTVLNIRQEVAAMVQQGMPASEMYRYLAKALMSKDETRLDATLNAIALHVPEGMDADSLALHGAVDQQSAKRPEAICLKQFQRNEELYHEAVSQMETIETTELFAYMVENNCPGPNGETLDQVSRQISSHQPALEPWTPAEVPEGEESVPEADITATVVGDGVEHPADSE